MRFLIVFLAYISFIESALAGQLEIRPGEYVRENSSGTLSIYPDVQNGLTFVIEATGGNCHSCGDVSGVLRGNRGYVDSSYEEGNDPACSFSFSPDHSSIFVEGTEACRFFCGARASFEGKYALLPEACTIKSRQAQRDESLTLYRSHRYSQSAKKLQALIAQCEEFMNWIEIDEVRNDLALAQYHEGDASHCIKTLNATLAGKVKDEEELRSGKGEVYLPPCDLDNYLPIAKATWFNKALCNKPLTIRP